MKIELASEKYSKQIIEFFDNNLDKDDKAVHSREFFCPFGVRAAVKRGQIIIGMDKDEIISAVRFYPRKTNEPVSIYQFAVDEKYRGEQVHTHIGIQITKIYAIRIQIWTLQRFL